MKSLISKSGIAIFSGALILYGLSVAHAAEKWCDPANYETLPNGRPAWTKNVEQLTWYNAGSTQYDPAIMEGVKAFEAHYGIEVKVVGIPEKQYVTRAARLLATGSTVYDLFDMYMAFPMPTWAARGWLAPIDCAVPEWLAQQWPEEVWQTAEYEGKHYYAPHLLQPFVFLWNKKLFTEAGLDPSSPPDNIQELISYAKKLTKDTNGDGSIDQWGFVFPAGKIQRVPILAYSYFLGMYGAQLWKDDGSPGFDNEKGVKAMQLMVDLVHEYEVTPISVLNSSTASVANIFASGDAAMVMHFMGHPVTKEMEVLGRGTVGAIPPPAAEGVIPQYPVGFVGPAVYVNAKSDNPVAAAHLAAFMGTYQQGWRESVLEDNIGANVNVWESPVLTGARFADLGQSFPFPKAAKYIMGHSYVPAHSGLLVAMTVFNEAIDAAITRKMSPKEAVDFIVSTLKERGVIE